jgi:D-alanyl-D-alanine carboxypeptidase (penicillin-binding protein 5/6)
MNTRAAMLGALNTRFVNPNGLPSPGEEQYSTARDLSRIARTAYANPLLREIMGTRRLEFQFADGHRREYSNTNQVLLRFPQCTGMKTGYTEAAGHCLVSSAEDGAGHTVIAVCLGDNKSIWNDSQRLLMWALAVAGQNG